MKVSIGNKDFTNITLGNKDISIYVGNKQVWPILDNICFSNGFWVDEFPWDDNFYWRD